MKGAKENERFHRMGELVVELVKTAHPYSEVWGVYDEVMEIYNFVVDGTSHSVNVNWSSTEAGLKDIASQFLSKDLCEL